MDVVPAYVCAAVAVAAAAAAVAAAAATTAAAVDATAFDVVVADADCFSCFHYCSLFTMRYQCGLINN